LLTTERETREERDSIEWIRADESDDRLAQALEEIIARERLNLKEENRKLRHLVFSYQDVWRMSLNKDWPGKVIPF